MNLVLSLASMAGGILPAILTGALAVEMAPSLRVAPAEISATVAVFFLSSAVASLVVGRAVDKTGFQRSLILAGLGSSSAMLGIAFLANEWLHLVLFLIAGGVANATAHAATTLLLIRTTPRPKQGMAFGIRQSANPAASILAGLSIPVIALTVGWRWAFAAASIVGLGVTLLVTTTSEVRNARVAHQMNRSSRLFSLVFLASTIGFGAGAGMSIQAFFVGSSVHAGLATGSAGGLMAVGSALGVIVRLLGGWDADRAGRDSLVVVAVMLGGGSLGCLLLATGNDSLLVLGALIAFAAGWGWSGLFGLAVASHHPDSPASAAGITQAAGYLGAATGPLLFGSLTVSGYGLAWIFASMMAAAGSLSALAARKFARGLSGGPPRTEQTFPLADPGENVN